MKYRKLKAGEVVKAGDEYLSVFAIDNNDFSPVQECTIGQAILACNAEYYRRPIKKLQTD